MSDDYEMRYRMVLIVYNLPFFFYLESFIGKRLWILLVYYLSGYERISNRNQKNHPQLHSIITVPMYPNKILIKGLNPDTTKEEIINYLEAKSREEVIDVSFGQDGETILATFKELKGIKIISYMIRRCIGTYVHTPNVGSRSTVWPFH